MEGKYVNAPRQENTGPVLLSPLLLYGAHN